MQPFSFLPDLEQSYVGRGYEDGPYGVCQIQEK